MPAGESAPRAFAVNPELPVQRRDELFLNQVVADLVDQLRLLLEDLLERPADTLPDQKPIRRTTNPDSGSSGSLIGAPVPQKKDLRKQEGPH